MKRLTYKKAGVDIEKANLLIERIKPLVKSTRTKGWLGNIGAFSGFFKIDFSKYRDPLMVSSTDGVGTKLLISKDLDKHDTVGIDLVAMSVNDIITCGAKPFFFLDYFASGRLEPRVMYDVIKGIARGCRQAGCSLVGGETAELPDMYGKGVYDLAGFCVGVVDKDKVIDGSRVKPGDVVLGIQSSGLHSNGYSLARKALSKRDIRTMRRDILKPTIIYVKPVLDLVGRFDVKGIANITGGGFYDNIIRALPRNAACVIRKGSWKVPKIFRVIQKKARVTDYEMHKTLNMGIGMVLVMSKQDAAAAKKPLLRKYRLKSWIIGDVIKGARKVKVI